MNNFLANLQVTLFKVDTSIKPTPIVKKFATGAENAQLIKSLRPTSDELYKKQEDTRVYLIKLFIYSFERATLHYKMIGSRHFFFYGPC